MKTQKRRSGILLHPSSLFTPFGIGDLGRQAYHFVDQLVLAGQKIWQVLPLGPVGYGNSPYSSFSAFAGNPLFISPELLWKEGFLPPSMLQDIPDFPEDKVDYELAGKWKKKILWESFMQFTHRASHYEKSRFNRFCEIHQYWLEDYSMFMAFKDYFSNQNKEIKSWQEWDPPIARRDPIALKKLSDKLSQEIRFHQYCQYAFWKQWLSLKQYGNQNGILFIGDAPIFVAYDSADVWAHPDLFDLDEEGKPRAVAGVPPDYFSETGQLWGNPLYNWKVLRNRKYDWWIARMEILLQLVDLVRLDHFRGFEAYWAIPYGSKTAVEGKWVKGPGSHLFKAFQAKWPHMPFIAEDLGVITPKVEELRDRFHLPGMKVLQFAFLNDSSNSFLPHYHIPHSVVYTGTHDNDTCQGWYQQAGEREKEYFLEYSYSDGTEVHWDMIRLAISSVSRMAIYPLQDVLGLDSSARMNTPSVEKGNWTWRAPEKGIPKESLARLAHWVELFGR